METIAVYWEERVKVYGITAQHDLALGILRFPANRMAHWGERLTELETILRRFEMVSCHGGGQDRIEIHLVVQQPGLDTLVSHMNTWLELELSAQFSLSTPVDMVFLHGPHFQDRFGIADAAFSALAKNKIPILLSGCAGTSMYIICAENRGTETVKILSNTFIIPTSA